LRYANQEVLMKGPGILTTRGTCYEGVLTVLAPDRIRLKTMTVQDRLK